MRIVAIDPGAKGAIAVFEDDTVTAIHDIPLELLAEGSKRKLPNVDVLRDLLDAINPEFVVIERVNAGPADGRASAGSFMLNFGTIIGAAAGRQRRYVLPTAWKTYAGLVGRVKSASVKKAHAKHPETADGMIGNQPNATDRADAVLIGRFFIDRVIKKRR